VAAKPVQLILSMIALPIAFFQSAAAGLAESLQSARTAWDWPSYIVIPLFLSAVLYVAGVIKLKHRTSNSHLALFPIVSFSAGLLALVAALDSPIHHLSEQLFWVHMTQHEILMLVAAPLIVLGQPLQAMLWAFPQKVRKRTGAVARNHAFKAAWLFASAPLCAWLLHGLALWLWHAPALFVATLRSEPVHAAQHISFFGSALLFWWALVNAHKGRLGYGKAILYIFSTGVHMSLLATLLTFSPTPWYAPYVITDTLRNVSPLADQQLGALIMWVPAGTVLLVIGLVFFWKWLQESDRRWEYTRTAALLRSMRIAHEN
jgi:putative membrane protein